MTANAPSEPLTEAERREWRERFVGHRAHLRQQIAAVDKIINELERFCAHEMTDRGHVGPYSHFVCARCGAEEFIL